MFINIFLNFNKKRILTIFFINFNKVFIFQNGEQLSVKVTVI